jgi:hypothetical protein
MQLILGCENKFCNELKSLVQPIRGCKKKYCNDKKNLVQQIRGCKNKYCNEQKKSSATTMWLQEQILQRVDMVAIDFMVMQRTSLRGNI